jgi:hypothetical protein
MSRRLKQVALAVVVVLIAAIAAAQLVRPERTNPAIDVTRTLQAQVGATSELVAVVDRSCGDCHSNGTVWARYTRVAPLSWVIARGVTEGRKAVNFSEWGAYPPDARRAQLAASCRDAATGKMPMRAYLLLRPEARLSPQDVQTICAAAREGEPRAASTLHSSSRSAP